MGSFLSPPDIGSSPQGAKQRYSPGELTDSRRPVTDVGKYQNPIGKAQNPIGNQGYSGGLSKEYRSNMPSQRLASPGGLTGQNGLASPSIGNPLGNAMGNQAASNIGLQGLQGLLSGIPAAMVGNAMGMSGRGILGMLGQIGMQSALGPIGLANALGGMGLSGYQGSDIAKSQGQSPTGLGSAAATSSLASNFGLLGMLGTQASHAIGTALGLDMGISPTNAAGEAAFGAEPGSQGAFGIDSPAQGMDLGIGNPGSYGGGFGGFGGLGIGNPGSYGGGDDGGGDGGNVGAGGVDGFGGY